MGYSERVCQLCATSFNIGRIRRPDEPRPSAWSNYGSDHISLGDSSQPCEKGGCFNVFRNADCGDDTLGQDEQPAELPLGDGSEHIAGPDCSCSLGYSGWRNTVAEMKERMSVQCLAVKLDNWQPEPGDEEYERESKHCFVTGISTEGPDEFDVGDLRPIKHGLSETMINNVNDGDFADDMWALPMHPHCFNIFKRISKLRLGRVDIDGLWQLRAWQGDYENRFKNFLKRPDVTLVSEQWYNAEPGTEYLAADPVEIPGLETMIRSCIVDRRSWREVLFDPPEGGGSIEDPFTRLSPELRLMLLTYLGIADVTNLRLASHVFKQIPQTYFHGLVQTDMPWVDIEALQGKTVDWYALWCKFSAADGGASLDEKQREWENNAKISRYDKLRKDLQKFKGTDWQAAWKERSEHVVAEAEAEIKAGRESGMWPPSKLTELKGLRNRRRIWEDVEEIVRRIAALSAEDRNTDTSDSDSE